MTGGARSGWRELAYLTLIVALHACLGWIAVRWRPAPVPAPPSVPVTVVILSAPPEAARSPPAVSGAAKPVFQFPDVAPIPPPRIIIAALPKPSDSMVAATAASPPPRETPPLAAPETSTSPAAVPSPAAMTTWQDLVRSRLDQLKRYPDLARLRRQQGIVYLRFVTDRNGAVLSARIERSSGYTALDEETLALVHRAEPLPKPPPEISGGQVELVIPLQFFLG